MAKKKTIPFNALLLSLKLQPAVSVSIIATMIVQGMLPVFRALVTARFLNTALTMFTVRQEEVRALYASAIIQAAILAGIIAIETLSVIVKELLSGRLELGLRRTLRFLLTEKRSKIQYHYYENIAILDLISRVSETPETKIRGGFFSYMNFFLLVLQLGSLVVLIAPSSWQTAAILIFMCIPLVVMASHSGKAIYKTKLVTQQMHRQYEYLDQVMTDRDTAQERNVFGFGRSMNELWHVLYEKVRKVELKTEAIWFIRTKANGILITIIMVVVIMFLINPLLAGAITIGLFISLVNAIYSLVDKIAWSLATYLEQITSINEYSRELKNFFALDEHTRAQANEGAAEPIAFHELALENVSFKYPGTETYVLNGFSHTFEKGKCYALVGVNGAGKTTLVKLLMGLYDDYKGKISINGIERRRYSYKQMKSLISVIYQDFTRYSLSVKDNVLIGRANDEEFLLDRDISEVLRVVGLEDAVKALPDDVETMLGKIYEGGQDLSGGQWQKLALARLVISDAPIWIMDEPTSALDPLNESRFYRDFFKISRERTTLLISHRLGAVMLADEILFLHNGRVAERGSHKDLMEKHGLYAEMYESQRRWYDGTGK
ncbi:MAG TPA: ABC transporter ATP-binding protein [Clostridia bacterium]|nr:ABC transporter ATP-binding protein [Clostridia bacterium]